MGLICTPLKLKMVSVLPRPNKKYNQPSPLPHLHSPFKMKHMLQWGNCWPNISQYQTINVKCTSPPPLILSTPLNHHTTFNCVLPCLWWQGRLATPQTEGQHVWWEGGCNITNKELSKYCSGDLLMERRSFHPELINYSQKIEVKILSSRSPEGAELCQAQGRVKLSQKNSLVTKKQKICAQLRNLNNVKQSFQTKFKKLYKFLT